VVNLLRNRVVTLDRFSWSVCSDLPGHFKTILAGQFVRFFHMNSLAELEKTNQIMEQKGLSKT